MKGFLISLLYLTSATFVTGSLTPLNTFTIDANIEDCQPWVDNNIIYIGALNNYLYAISFNTGYVIWSIELNEPVCLFPISVRLSFPCLFIQVRNSPVVKEGILFIGSAKTIYALNASTGSLNWTYTCGGNVTRLIHTSLICSSDQCQS